MGTPLTRIQGIPYVLSKIQDAAASVTASLQQQLSTHAVQLSAQQTNAPAAAAFAKAIASKLLSQQGQQLILGASPGGGAFIGANLASGQNAIHHNLGRIALGVRFASFQAASVFSVYWDPTDSAQTNQNQTNVIYVQASAAGLCVLEVL